MANEIRAAFRRTFRDFVTDGIPSSGKHKVKKSDGRNLGDVIQDALDGLPQGYQTSEVGSVRQIAPRYDTGSTSGPSSGSFITGSPGVTATPMIVAGRVSATHHNIRIPKYGINAGNSVAFTALRAVSPSFLRVGRGYGGSPSGESRNAALAIYSRALSAAEEDQVAAQMASILAKRGLNNLLS